MPLLALVGAGGISWAGNALARVAIPWFVLETGGSPARAGLVIGFEMLPLAFGSVFGGVLVDRLGHKRGTVLADIASGVAVALIPLLAALGALSLPVLMALIFAGALLDSAGIAARKALLPDVAARAAVPLEDANAAHATTLRLAIVLGPVLGGVLIPVIGVSDVLAVDAVTFAVSALLIGRLVPSVRARSAGQTSSYGTALVDGLRFVRSDGQLKALLVTPTLLAVLVSPVFFVALPAYLNDAGSALALGLVYAAYGGGAALGSLGYAVLDKRMGRRTLLVLCAAGQAAGVAALATLPPPPILLAASLLVGVAYGPISPLVGVVVGERTPGPLRARVFGAVAAPMQLATPLGLMAGGALLATLSVGPVLTAAAVCCAALTLAQLLSPALRSVERPSASRDRASADGRRIVSRLSQSPAARS